jgi:hypothetical protein
VDAAEHAASASNTTAMAHAASCRRQTHRVIYMVPGRSVSRLANASSASVSITGAANR